MNFKRTIMLLGLTLIFASLGLYTRQAMAAGCSGLTCENLNPATMGCTAFTDGPVKELPYDGNRRRGTVETRKSTNCNARWARVYNRSGLNRYAAGTIHCGTGGSIFPCRSVSSPGPIASSSTVGIFTNMTSGVTASGGSKNFKSCGSVQASGPISIPISQHPPYDHWCTGTTQ